MNKSNKYLISFIAIILIFLFTPLFALLYEKIFGPTSVGFWGPSNPGYISGFFLSYSFFVPLSIMLFGKEKKYKLFLFLIGILLFVDIWLTVWEDLIINLAFVFIGSLFGIVILAIKKELFKK